jgi:hypothetical protein
VEIDIYDASLAALGVIDEITSFIWTRKYWETGEFKLLAPFTRNNSGLIKKNYIIAPHGSDEAAQILYVAIRQNAEGAEEIEAQGRFLTSWLDKRIILEQLTAVGSPAAIIESVIDANLVSANDMNRVIPDFTIAPANIDGAEMECAAEKFTSCLEICSNLSKAAELGYKAATDFMNKKHVFIIYRGRDLTAGQDVNPPCVFAPEFDNILEQEYTLSVENEKTTAYVTGETRGDAPPQVVEIYGDISGLERNETYVSASGVKKTYVSAGVEKTLSAEEYNNQLAAYGTETLRSLVEALSFSSKINQYVRPLYKEDFDVGDIVTCVNKRWGVALNTRITEISETYQGERTDIDITFGEDLPTLTEKMQMRRWS